MSFLKDTLLASKYDLFVKTPLERANKLSDTFDNHIMYKREDLQVCNSFKIRGVYNKMKKISKTQTHVVCASTGNHAHAVAYVGMKFGLKVYIFMPKNTNNHKISALSDLGANIILNGDNYDESVQYAQTYCTENKYEFIDQFEDFDILTGNGTIALEIIDKLDGKIDELDYIFIPIGGGGLISSIGLVIKELYPHIKIIGVGVENSCSLAESLKNKKITEIKEVNNFVDSTAIKVCGKLPFEISSKVIDEILLINNDEICSALKYIYEDIGTIVEPVSALGVAGVMKFIDKHKLCHKNFIVVLSGGRLSFNKLKYVAERANIGNKTELLVKVTIPEEKGSLLEFLKYINSTKDMFNITKFHYKYNNEKAFADILLGISSGSEIDLYSIVNIIENEYTVNILKSDIVSLYVPYIVASHRKKIYNEYIFTFTIPEKVGSLLELLLGIDESINIIMFHYNNMDDNYAYVLVGVQLLNITYKDFIDILDRIKFLKYVDETNNIKLIDG